MNRGRLKRKKRIVFTNGCFDILHLGHVRYLKAARKLGTKLVVGLNSDASVRRLKGPGRPLNKARERAEVLLALACVDQVKVFSEPTPLKLIRRVKPDVLVKGGDWPVSKIVGAEFVQGRGGRVLSLPFVKGRSSSRLIAKLRALG